MIGPRSVFGTFAPVPGSPTPRELAVADGSVRKYRIGPWSSWGIRSENGQRPVGDGQRGTVTSGPEPAGRGLSHEQARGWKAGDRRDTPGCETARTKPIGWVVS